MSVREGKTSHINGICSQKVGYALKTEGASKEKETEGVFDDILHSPRPTYMSCQFSISISITHATCKLYFLHLDL